MINTTDIVSAWQRIGWNEPSKTGYTSILDTDNKTSLSGLKFDALHALANFVNVKDTYSDSAASSAVMNALLTDWQKNAIIELCKEVFKEDYVEQGTLLNDPIDFTQTITPNSLFVGWKVVVPQGYVLTIKSVELLFDTVATFNLYVFNESQLTAITALTTSATTVANSVKIVSPTAWNLYGKSLVFKTGTYYIGYIQTTPKAIQRNYYGVKSVCRFVPIQATANGTNLPAYASVSETGYTFGLNFDYVVRKDFTSDYLNNVDLFDKAIGISVICKLLEQIHFSPRINQNERASKEGMNALSAKAFLDLNGSAEDNPEIPYKRGLLREYQDEVKNIRERLYRKNKLIVTTLK